MNKMAGSATAMGFLFLILVLLIGMWGFSRQLVYDFALAVAAGAAAGVFVLGLHPE